MDNREGNLFEDGKENESIHRVLTKILEKWCNPTDTAGEELTETLPLSPEGTQKEVPPPPFEAEKTQEMIPDTVIILPQGTAKEASTSSSEVKSKPIEPPRKDEFLEETVILKTGKVREKVDE